MSTPVLWGWTVLRWIKQLLGRTLFSVCLQVLDSWLSLSDSASSLPFKGQCRSLRVWMVHELVWNGFTDCTCEDVHLRRVWCGHNSDVLRDAVIMKTARFQLYVKLRMNETGYKVLHAPSFTATSFQAARLSCYLLKWSWAIVLQAFWRSFFGHWLLFHSFSRIKKAPNSRDEPVLCLHITDNLAKKPF